jgi:hypothetical protein
MAAGLLRLERVAAMLQGEGRRFPARHDWPEPFSSVYFFVFAAQGGEKF